MSRSLTTVRMHLKLDAPDVALPHLFAYRRGRPRAASPLVIAPRSLVSTYVRGLYSRTAALDYGDESLCHRLLPSPRCSLRIVVPPLPAAILRVARFAATSLQLRFPAMNVPPLVPVAPRSPTLPPLPQLQPFRRCCGLVGLLLLLVLSCVTLLDRCLEKLRGSVETRSRRAELVEASPTAFSFPFVFNYSASCTPFTSASHHTLCLLLLVSFTIPPLDFLRPLPTHLLSRPFHFFYLPFLLRDILCNNQIYYTHALSAAF
ncbi:hypothetical protein K438DRAFT_759906 [Mycena galopus ATCC 62051]|nr:hypothetical protein K438DRAFT_759906 [Mycena galopus ATCC 62051]